MTMQVPKPETIAPLWRDAALLSLATTWEANGAIAVMLRCALNPAHNRQPLAALGLRGPVVAVTFRGVLIVSLNVPARLAHRETVGYWHADSTVGQHSVNCSGGTSLNLRCADVWLSDGSET